MKAKGKRLLSILLAAMLIIGMIPLSASAATNVPSVKLWQVDLAEDGLLTTGGRNPGTLNASQFTSKAKAAGDWNQESSMGGSAEDGSELQKMVDKANALIKPSSAAISNAEGTKVYLAVKVDLTGMDSVAPTGKGWCVATAYFKLPADTFEIGSSVIHPLNNKFFDMNQYYWTGCEDYYGTGSITASIANKYEDGKTSADAFETLMVTLGNDSMTTSDQYAYPHTKTTWDALIQLKVKPGATAGAKDISFVGQKLNGGSSTINIVSETTGASLTTVLAAQGYNNTMSGSTINVTFESNDPDFKLSTTSIGPGVSDNNVITLTPNKHAEWSDAIKAMTTATTANIGNYFTTTGGPSVTSIQYNAPVAPDTKGTVTLKMDGGSTAGAATLTIKGAAYGNGSGADIAAKDITVINAPNVDWQVESNGDVTITSTDASMQYKIGGTDDWKDCSASNTTITGADLTALIAATTTTQAPHNLHVKYKTDAAEVAVKGLTVAQQEAPTASSVTVSYENETVTVPSGAKWKVGNGAEQTGSGSVTSFVPTTGSAADLTVYVPAAAGNSSSGKIQSKSYTATGAITVRPAAVGGSAKADDAAKLAGNTIIENYGTGTYYWMDTSSGTPSSVGAGAKAVPTGGVITGANTTKYIHLYKPAKDSDKAFRSAFQTPIKGTGNNYATIAASGEAGTKTVTLTIKGGDSWKSGAAAGDFTLSPSITVSGVNPSGNTMTLTLASDLAENTEYTVTINAGNALTNGQTPKGENDAADIKFTASSKGYKLNAGTNTHEGVAADTAVTWTGTKTSGIQSSDGALTFNVTGLKDYETLTGATITVKNASGTAVGTVSDITDNGNKTGSFKWTAPDTTTSKVELTVVIDTKKAAAKTIDSTSLDATTSGLSAAITKPYDTNNSATALVTLGSINVVAGSKFSDGKTNVTVTFTGATYDSATAGSGKTITLTGVELAGTDAGYYTLNGATTLTLSGGSISQLAATSITVPALTTKNNNAQAVVDALKGAAITMNGTIAEQGASGALTLGELLAAKSDADWLAMAEAAVAATYPAGDEITLDLTDPTVPNPTTIASVKPGDKIVLTLADGDSVTTASTGYTLEADGKTITVGAAATTGLSISVTGTHTATVTPTITKVDAAKADWDAAANQTVNVTIGGSDLNAVPLSTNYSGVASLTLTASVTVKKKKAPVSTGVVVGFISAGFVQVDMDEVEVDDDGKIILPTVTSVVKGALFYGWTDKEGGTQDDVIDPETAVFTEDTQLYAVLEGYMTGVGGNKMNPTGQTTRAQLLRMLLVSAGIYDRSVDYGDSKFIDANEDGWSSNYIACAERYTEETGKTIIAGYELADGSYAFRPKQPVTREEAAAMIARVFGVTVTAGSSTDKVSDFASVPDWAKDSVAALCENGTIHGYEEEDGTYTFRGGNPIARNEMSHMVNKYLGLTEDDVEAIKADSSIESPFTDVTNHSSWDFADLMFASLNVGAEYYGTEITIPTGDDAE